MTTRPADDPIEAAYRALSAALYAHDGPAAIAAFETLDVSTQRDLCQHAGEAILLGLAQGVSGATGAAGLVINALRQRDADGDDDLAVEIEAVLGLAAAPDLRALPIDLDDLTSALEGDPNLTGGRIDLRTGDVHLVSPLFGGDDDIDPDEGSTEAVIGDGDATGEAEERWLRFDSLGSRAGFDDMRDFLATVPDERLAGRLERALGGRGPFRRFKDALADSPAELARFHRFTDDRRLGRARAWLAENALRPDVPASPRQRP